MPEVKSLLVVSVLSAASVAGCGNDAFCRQGCITAEGHTVVRWTFDVSQSPPFSGDSCSDVGAALVRVSLVDTNGYVTTQEETCDVGSIDFIGLRGLLQASVVPLDAQGSSLTGHPVLTSITAGLANPDEPSDTTVNIPEDAWIRAYTGTLRFRLSWGGQSCPAASPTVVFQVLTLTVNGHSSASMTNTNQKLDGTQEAACEALENATPLTVTGLPFGPATLTVVGEDAAHVATYQGTFDIVVGAGENPVQMFDSPAL